MAITKPAIWVIVGCCCYLGEASARAGLYERGLQALSSGRVQEAIGFLEKELQNNSDNLQAWWELGWAYWRQQNFDKTRQAWLQVKQRDPKWPDLMHWLQIVETKRQLKKVVLRKPAIQLQAQPGASVSFAAAGDTMMGTALRKGQKGLAPGNGEALFEHVSEIFAAVDVAFLNLEGPLADDLPQKKCRPNSVSCYAFRTPTRYVAALKAASIDVVSCANNHAMDVGAAGMESTMRALESVGIAHAGRYGDSATLQVRDLKIAFLAAHSGSCCLNVNNINEVVAAIQLADQAADLVVLSFHGGAEGSKARHVTGRLEKAYGEKRGNVRALARAAVDAGADLILGHGPHVLRGIEVYKGRLVVYSLGNFMGYKQFGLRGGYGGTSVIVHAQLAPNGALVSARLHPLYLDKESVPHPDSEKRAWKQIDELSKLDFPVNGVRVLQDGQLSWKGKSK